MLLPGVAELGLVRPVPAGSVAGMTCRRPSIIQIVTDHQAISTLAGPGRHRQAPATSRLAREGMAFTQATTSTPLCGPARCAMQTGRYATNLGVPSNRWGGHVATGAGGQLCGPGWGIPTLPAYLKPAGYRCGFLGKLHMSGSPGAYGYDDVLDPFATAAAAESADDGRWRPRSFAQYLTELGVDPQRRPRVDQTARGVHYFRGGAWHALSGRLLDHAPEHTGSAWLFAEAARLLESYAAADQPFCLQIHLAQEPHWPFVVPEPFASLYDPRDLPEPANFHDPAADHPLAHRRVAAAWHTEGQPWSRWAESTAKYLGLMAMIETQAASFLEVVDRLGLARDTAVVWTADHGAANGAHGIFDKDHRMIEETCRIPLLVRWPAGGVVAGGESPAMAQNLDLLPTYLELAGLPVPAAVHGRSLLPAARGGEDPRDHAYVVSDGMPWGLRTVRMVRTPTVKYVWNAFDRHEFYDLRQDPHELRNAIDDPAQAGEVARCRRLLLAELQRTDDHMLEFAACDLGLDGSGDGPELADACHLELPPWLGTQNTPAGYTLQNICCHAVVPEPQTRRPDGNPVG